MILIPELSHSSDLHLAIKYVHRKMDALPRSESNAGNRVIVTDLIAELNKISLGIDRVKNDEYSESLARMTSNLLPIVNAYSLTVARNIQIKKNLERKKKLLDDIYLSQMQKEGISSEIKSKIHKLYILSRSLSDISTSFLLKRTEKEILLLNKELANNSHVDKQLFNVINNQEQGIISTLRKKNDIAVSLSVLNTQTNVIIEQLISVTLEKVTELEGMVKTATIQLKKKSTDFTNIITSIVALTTFFTLALMMYFHKQVSKRLMTIAISLGRKENQKILENETNGTSEISVIAKSILKYRAHNELQRDKIANSVNQLKFIIENSSQAVIIYREDRIVFCNRYSQDV